jgi:3-phenylpropionate/trans-cinnamate dioxygenase ferredoxin reductase subunit
MAPTFVIVGASLAGASAAAALRQAGFDGQVMLIGAEPHFPYERPPLSKQYLRGEIPFEKTLVRPAAFYQQNRIETVFGVRVTRVDPAERTVALSTGQHIRYDKLLLATGVRNRRPPIPGLDLPGVLTLRSAVDSDALRDEVRPGRRAVVIGMGFIGCEVAASLRQQGVDVVSVDPSPTPLFRSIGPEVGGVLAEIHQEHGVESIFGDGVAAFEGDRRLRRVLTSRRRSIECDFAVAGIGVEPEVDFIAGSGIETDNGVLVDEHCRSTADGIFAAGDVANHYHPLLQRRIRVEHWQNAMQQGAAAARNMLGKRESYAPVHWFWSDQYDMNLQYAGLHLQGDRIVVRGSLESRQFLAFYINGDRINAVVSLNRGKDLRRVMPLIKARTPVEVAKLVDESVDLRSLLHASPTDAGQEGVTT